MSAHRAWLPSIALGLLALGFSCGAAAAADAIPAEVAAAVKNPGRPQFDLYRDERFKPGEVMAFSGIRSGMIVTEILPETGYWTRILSGTVGQPTEFYIVVPMGKGATGRGGAGGPMIKDRNQNEEYNRVELARSIDYQPEFPNIKFIWTIVTPIVSVPKQLDALVVANNYAKLRSGDLAHIDGLEMTKGFYRTLKSGGIYFVIGAAANRGTGFSAANLGRVDPDAVKAEALAAGFQLDGESNLLSRPNDPRTAPADDNSDMFVLRFKKPANAPNTDKRLANVQETMKGYFGYTRRTNPGLIRKDGETGGPQRTRERRVMFHPDMTYQEWGQQGSGDNPWQSGIYYFDSDNNGCMLHLFPMDQSGFNDCDERLAPPGMKMGDRWCEGSTIREFIGPGYYQYPNKPATEGGTIGDTPQEVARNFGDLFGYSQRECTKDLADQYLRAYYSYRRTAGIPAPTLDAEFSKGYGGKPVPAPLPADTRQD